MIQVEIDTQTPTPNGKGVYWRDELVLDYQLESKYNLKNGTTLIIFDTLTICFDKDQKSFLSLDDYTNHDLWNFNAAIDCSFSSIGTLKIIESITESNRYFVDIKPTYEYSSNSIKINLGNCLDSNSHKISNNLIVRIKEGIITSFTILNPNYESMEQKNV